VIEKTFDTRVNCRTLIEGKENFYVTISMKKLAVIIKKEKQESCLISYHDFES
jgi:hypothetical protein